MTSQMGLIGLAVMGQVSFGAELMMVDPCSHL